MSDILEDDIQRLTHRKSLPMIWGILAILLFTLVDTYFISLLGSLPLAAVGFLFPVTFVVTSLAVGMGIGISAVLGRMLGAGKKDQAARYTTDGLLLATVSVALISLVGFFTIDPLFSALGATPDVLVYIKDYMGIWYASVSFLVIPMVGNSAIRATGDIKTPSIVMTICGLVNAVLDPILIFGVGPIPSLGVKGAALATAFSWIISFIVAFHILYRREKLLLLSLPVLSELRSNWKTLLNIGVPAGISQMLNPLANMIIVRILAGFGPLAVAAFGVGTRFEGLLLIPVMAFVSVLPTIIGQNLGAKKFERAKESLLYTTHLSLVVQTALFVLVFICAPLLAAPFSEDELVRQLSINYLRVLTVSYGLVGVTMVLTQVLNILHRPKTSLSIHLIRLVVIVLPATYVGGYLYGAKGVFIALSLSHILIGLFCYAGIRYLANRLEGY